MEHLRTVEEQIEAMKKPNNIRNIIVIGDNQSSSFVNKIEDVGAMGKFEGEVGSLRAKNVATSYLVKPSDDIMALCKASLVTDGNQFLINAIKCQEGQVDSIKDSLKIVDGSIVVVDCVSGVSVLTEALLRLSLMQYVKPFLLMSKMERALLELEQEDVYQTFSRIIESTNVIIAMYTDDDGPMGQCKVDPTKLNVAFGSTHGWSFTLYDFATIYAAKFKIEAMKLIKRLWGDNYFSAKEKKWNKSGGDGYVRGFNQFVLDPIYTMFDAVMNFKTEEFGKLLQKLNIKLSCEEKELEGKSLLKVIMKKWLPDGDGLNNILPLCLPSPVVAQKYRASILYTGPLDDEVGLGIKECNPEKPLMMYVASMVPSADKGRFFAYGRVFSGKVVTGQRVRIMGPNYQPGKEDDLYLKEIHKKILMRGNTTCPVDEVPCGNMCALVGIDQYLVKTGAITTYEAAFNIKCMGFSVANVVQVAVEPKDPQHLPQLVEGLKQLAKADRLIGVIKTDSGFCVTGPGELVLEIALKDLEEDYACIQLKKCDPVVSYRETVNGSSSFICLSKSPNKHNRLYFTATPMPDGLPQDIDSGKITYRQDNEERAQILANEYGYAIGEARKIWCFGPERTGPNILVDCSKGVRYIDEIKGHVITGFQWATKEGVLCEENMRGIRFNFHDVTLNTDAIHRGGGQTIPTARRVLYASVLTASPRILEPVYVVQIDVHTDALDSVYRVLNKRRGLLLEEHKVVGTPMSHMKAYLPVNESFGFTVDLRLKTQGKGFHDAMFDHWQVINDDPLDSATRSGSIVSDIRKRKGLSEDVPPLDRFLDKL